MFAEIKDSGTKLDITLTMWIAPTVLLALGLSANTLVAPHAQAASNTRARQPTLNAPQDDAESNDDDAFNFGSLDDALLKMPRLTTPGREGLRKFRERQRLQTENALRPENKLPKTNPQPKESFPDLNIFDD